MKRPHLPPFLLGVVLLAGCHDEPGPTTPLDPSYAAATAAAPAPAPLVSLTAGGVTQEIWPFTGVNFTGAGQDPINLIFVGQADPRSIRAALFALNGDRSAFGFPNVFPFNCTWRDALGGLQTAYSEAAGWEGSVIQLECGEYETVRFHIRLFPAGPWTLANAHVDVLIPGTHDHQVLTWELGEQLVTVDFIRSGLLGAAPAQTGPINPAPFGAIPAVIYNALPPQLRQLTGGPLTNVSAPVPLQTDGRATILTLAGSVAPTPGTATQDFVLQYNQVIPKPFCNPGNAWVFVQGPIELRLEVQVSPTGELTSTTVARGELTATPFNPIAGTPIGPPLRARISEDYATVFTGAESAISVDRLALLKAPNERPERLDLTLQVGPGERTRFRAQERCWH